MTSYSTVQKQQLSQLGAYLQEKRQEQGKSLEDISLQTYIRAQLLKAVETGDTSDLPQPIFVQGFIRRYADALGLDGTNFAKQFPVHSIPNTPRPVPRPATPVDMSYPTAAQKPPIQVTTPSPSQTAAEAMPVQPEPKPEPSPVLESVGAPEKTISAQPEQRVPVPVTDTTDSSEDLTLEPTAVADSQPALLGLDTLSNGVGTKSAENHQSASSEPVEPASLPDADEPVGVMPPVKPIGSSLSSSESSGISWLTLGIGAVLLGGAIALIGPRIIGGGNNQPPEPSEAVAPQAPPTEVSQPAVEAPAPVAAEPEPAASEAPVSLQVEITEAGPSWMRIVVDGELAFEGLMDPGTTETWEGQESITMNVGNAGAALVSANGSDPIPAGNPGGAEFLTFNATNNSEE